MSNPPRFDPSFNDNGHDASLCACESCMPEGADGLLDDALEAARVETGLSGSFNVKPGKVTVVSWSSPMGNRRDVARSALRTAAKHLAKCGLSADVLPGTTDLYVSKVA